MAIFYRAKARLLLDRARGGNCVKRDAQVVCEGHLTCWVAGESRSGIVIPITALYTSFRVSINIDLGGAISRR